MSKNLIDVLRGAPVGEWAALTPDKQRILASARTVEEAAEKARQAGVNNPFLVFVPMPEIGLAASVQDWVVQYPYIRITQATAPRPYLSLVFRNGYATHSSLGLVDTGADFSIFPTGFAKILNLDLASGTARTFRGTTGKLQIGYSVRFELSIMKPDDTVQAQFVISDFEACFSEDFEFPGGGLLGQDDFLSRFHACFDQPRGLFTIDQI